MPLPITPRRLLAWLLTLAALFLASMPSQAVPAFARQTGKACSSCHFQHFPVLNEFGQDFKSSGYVDIKNKPVSGTDLSLADTLYAAIYTKLRYQKTNGTEGTDTNGLKIMSTHSGEWQLPDEFSLLLGGRIAKNVGFIVEAGLNNDGKVLAGFKIPFVWELGSDGMKASVVPFSTDNLGASYGFELLSTGAVRNIRVSEHNEETSAQQYVFFTPEESGAAAGFSFVLYDPKFFVSVTPYTPNHTPGGDSNLGGLKATYLRAAFTPRIGDWALAAGVQIWSGNNVRVGAGPGVEQVKTKGWAIDAQAQGAVAGMPLGVYLAHAKAPGSSAGAAPNHFNREAHARTATSITAELGVIPAKVTLMASLRRADDGSAASSSDNAFSLGATYQMYQNVQLQAVHSTRQKSAGVGRYGPTDSATGAVGGGALTTLMLSAAY